MCTVGSCRIAAIDAELECTQLLHCRVEELSKRAASDLIDHLQNLQRLFLELDLDTTLAEFSSTKIRLEYAEANGLPQ